MTVIDYRALNSQLVCHSQWCDYDSPPITETVTNQRDTGGLSDG